jgi:hypothetical protein
MIHVVFSLIGEGGQRNEYFPKPYSLAQAMAGEIVTVIS